MSAGDTFRVDLRAGLKSILDAWTNAGHAFDLVETLTERPESLARPTPFGFVSLGDESASFDTGTRQRVIPASLVVVDRITNNKESTARLDPIVDGILLTLSQNAHLTSESVWSNVRVITNDEPDGDSYFRSVTFDLGDVTVRDGRP